jgi:hypothetical protein
VSLDVDLFALLLHHLHSFSGRARPESHEWLNPSVIEPTALRQLPPRWEVVNEFFVLSFENILTKSLSPVEH